MKKYIILIALTFVVTSCSKDNKKYCWQCITSSNITTTHTKIKICDKTEYEIRAIEISTNADSIIIGDLTVHNKIECTKN